MACYPSSKVVTPNVPEVSPDAMALSERYRYSPQPNGTTGAWPPAIDEGYDTSLFTTA